MTTHELKIHPPQFAAIRDGRKTFELRRDDRGFKEGDELVLREWNPDSETYTGQAQTVRVSYVLRSADGLGLGFVVMSIAGCAGNPHRAAYPVPGVPR